MGKIGIAFQIFQQGHGGLAVFLEIHPDGENVGAVIFRQAGFGAADDQQPLQLLGVGGKQIAHQRNGRKIIGADHGVIVRHGSLKAPEAPLHGAVIDVNVPLVLLPDGVVKGFLPAFVGHGVGIGAVQGNAGAPRGDQGIHQMVHGAVGIRANRAVAHVQLVKRLVAQQNGVDSHPVGILQHRAYPAGGGADDIDVAAALAHFFNGTDEPERHPLHFQLRYQSVHQILAPAAVRIGVFHKNQNHAFRLHRGMPEWLRAGRPLLYTNNAQTARYDKKGKCGKSTNSIR